jgi:hypothetical protein
MSQKNHILFKEENMMKSFFKKLAFVMALAMVVSLVAPAGSAFAAESGIALQGTKEVVTTYEVTEGYTKDFCFLGAPKDWKSTYKWTSSDEKVATVDKAGVVTAESVGTATITITAGADASYVETVEITVVAEVEEMVPAQKTATMVQVTFSDEKGFDLTGEEANGNTLKVYRVFSTEEMAKMTNTNGFIFDETGRGYQAHYVMSATPVWDNVAKAIDYTTWDVEGYNAFVDNALYCVVYGPNATSSEFDPASIREYFTAYVGKVAYIDITATEATVENDVEPAVPAYLTTRLYNSHDIDLTDYYKNADETDYELVTENIEASISGNEVTFDEAGTAMVKGTYTFYDEDLEEDVPLTDEEPVKAGKYSTYRVERIYKWTLKDGTWAKPDTTVIAGDADQLYVIVEDNRGNLYTNRAECTIDGKAVKVVGDDKEDTAFEQYGYELVFDSLDPDSLLVNPDGAVETYKETNSFAVVSYKNINDDTEKLHEIGVMCINVTAPRKLDSVKFEGFSINLLAETEGEDGKPNYYAADSAFKLAATAKVSFLNQYGKAWDSLAEDWAEVETEFVVTTTKDAFDEYADAIEAEFNLGVNGGAIEFTPDMFDGTNTTSVSFKVKELATGDSKTITVKLNKPKYNDDGTVYVDPNRAILDVAGKDMYVSTSTTANLFQVSKASQKVGYMRTGLNEVNFAGEGYTYTDGEESIFIPAYDQNRAYYVGNTVAKKFYSENGSANFVSVASGSAMTYVASASSLEVDDYILVVVDPKGNVVPALGVGYGKNKDTNIGISATETGYVLNLAYEDENGEMVYAEAGTYVATVYKITNISGEDTVKFVTSRVDSHKFTVSKTVPTVTFFHQKDTKDVEGVGGAFENDADVVQAISETMTFKINGTEFKLVDGKAVYKYNDDYASLPIEINMDDEDENGVADGLDYKIQNNGQRAVVNTVTFKVYTPAGGYILLKVKVNRSINIAE